MNNYPNDFDRFKEQLEINLFQKLCEIAAKQSSAVNMSKEPIAITTGELHNVIICSMPNNLIGINNREHLDTFVSIVNNVCRDVPIEIHINFSANFYYDKCNCGCSKCTAGEWRMKLTYN